MKKRTFKVLSIIMALFMLLTVFPLSVFAAVDEYTFPEGTTFISKFGFTVGHWAHEQNDAKDRLTGAGFNLVSKDLNDGCGAGSGFIFMGYKTSTSYADAIHGIRFLHSGDHPDVIVQNINGKNIDFCLVGGGREPKVGNTDDPLDLNRHAGGDSDYIYCYITRDPDAGPPITNVAVDTSEHLSGYYTAGRINAPDKPSDLNANAGGDYIYLHYNSNGVTGPLHSQELRNRYAESLELLKNKDGYINANELITCSNNAKTVIDALDNHSRVVTQNEISTAEYNLRTAINNLETYLYFDASYNGGVCNTEKLKVKMRDQSSVTVDISQYTAQKAGWEFLGWSSSPDSNSGSKTTLTIGFKNTVYAIFTTDVNAKFNYLDAGGSVITENRNAVLFNIEAEKTVESPYPPASAQYNGKTLTFKGFRTDETVIDPEYSTGYITLQSGHDYVFNSIYSAPVTIDFIADGAVNVPSSVSGTILYNAGNKINNNTCDIVIPDTVPAKAGHTFKGWATAAKSDRVSYIAGATIRGLSDDMTLTALWDVNNYNVKFVNYDGTVLQEETLSYLSTPVYKCKTPVKESTDKNNFTFAGWDSEISAVNGDVVYTATFAEELRSYPVIFKNYDRTVLYTVDVPYGSVPSYAGETPLRESNAQYDYTFKSWDKAFSAVTGPQEYVATFNSAVRNYTVKFVDYNGDILDEQLLPYGTETLIYQGNTPYRSPSVQFIYSFENWTPEIKTVTGNAEYRAVYSTSPRTYKVQFIDEAGNVLQENILPYGKKPLYIGETPLKEKDVQYNYIFNGWDKEVVPVEADVVYTVSFMKVLRRYTVTFYNEDGATKLQQNDIPYGSKPVYANPLPKKAPVDGVPYIFTGWTPAIAEVTGNADYVATFVLDTNNYNVKFVNENGEILQEESLAAGTMPEYKGAEPEKAADENYAYTFTGWNKVLEPVSSDIVYTAVYSGRINSFTVRFLAEDGTELQKSIYKYGDTPVFGYETPSKAPNSVYHYEFAGWDKEISPVDCNITYAARFKAVEHNFVFDTVSAPTCTEQGKIVYKCECGYTYTQYEHELGHDYHYIEENGKAYKECANCGDRIEVPLEELQNDPDAGRCPYCGRYHHKYIFPDFGWISCFISRIFDYFAELFKNFNA